MVMRQALLLMLLAPRPELYRSLEQPPAACILYGVTASDQWTVALAPLGLALCGLAAAVVPARRAAGLNPVDTLRAE